jgi:hypothetical protein
MTTGTNTHWECIISKAAPLQAFKGFRSLRLPEFLDIWHMKAVRLSAELPGRLYPPPPPPRKYHWYSFLLEGESTPGTIVGPEGLIQWNNPMIPSGIESATFRLAAAVPWTLAVLRTPENVQYLLLFHSNSGYANALQCYVVCPSPVLLTLD